MRVELKESVDDDVRAREDDGVGVKVRNTELIGVAVGEMVDVGLGEGVNGGAV